MPRQSILLFLGLALVGVSQTAVAAEAKDDKQNRIYSRSTCSQSLKKARQDHSIEYPFNIKRIRTIYQRSNPKIIVNTAIIDNGFLGYTLDFNDGESRRVPGP